MKKLHIAIFGANRGKGNTGLGFDYVKYLATNPLVDIRYLIVKDRVKELQDKIRSNQLLVKKLVNTKIVCADKTNSIFTDKIINAIFIASPPETHKVLLQKALLKRIAVSVEKPPIIVSKKETGWENIMSFLKIVLYYQKFNVPLTICTQRGLIADYVTNKLIDFSLINNIQISLYSKKKKNLTPSQLLWHQGPHVFDFILRLLGYNILHLQIKDFRVKKNQQLSFTMFIFCSKNQISPIAIYTNIKEYDNIKFTRINLAINKNKFKIKVKKYGSFFSTFIEDSDKKKQINFGNPLEIYLNQCVSCFLGKSNAWPSFGWQGLYQLLFIHTVLKNITKKQVEVFLRQFVKLR